MSQRQAHYLHLMGITRWRERTGGADVSGAQAPVNGDAAEPPQATASGVAPDVALQQLSNEVAACTRCPLHATRTQTVFGVGPASARLMFIGEAPGEREDQRGEPFVGPAGQLLNAMLRAIDLERDDAYIANILKCRPPRNRDPSAAETAACTSFLLRQLELIQPQLVVALGRVAAQYLLQTTTALGRLRGQVHDYLPAGDGSKPTPFVVTYHPAYLLRSPAEKRRSWDDLKLIREVLQSTAPERTGEAHVR